MQGLVLKFNFTIRSYCLTPQSLEDVAALNLLSNNYK